MSKKKTKVSVEITRRDILTLAGVAAGSAVASVVLTSGPLSPFSGMQREQLTTGAENAGHGATGEHHWGMVIDLERCIGCEYCLRTCSATNDVASDKPWNIVIPEQTSSGDPFYFSRPCLHCQSAPCVEVCPVRICQRDVVTHVQPPSSGFETGWIRVPPGGRGVNRRVAAPGRGVSR